MDIKNFYTERGSPIRCWRCYGNKIKGIATSYIADMACEVDYSCQFCNEYLAFWAYGAYNPYIKESVEKVMLDSMESQRKEFDAAESFAQQLSRLQMTPVIDDDYPQVRHEYEGALAAFIESMKENGRFGKSNRYNLYVADSE